MVTQKIVDLSTPVTDDDLSHINSETTVVQFSQPMTDADHTRVAKVLQDFPSVPLRVYGYNMLPLPNLQFLKNYPKLRGFRVDVFHLGSFDGMEYLPYELEYLGIGQTKKAMSLKVLKRFTHLKELYLEKHMKDIDVIRHFALLEKLNLRSITLKDLSILLPLKKLWWFTLKLGGTTNLALLPQIGRIKYLELWMVKGLTDLSFISNMIYLQNLFLQDLKNVETLPDFSRCAELRRVRIDNLKTLRDISPLLSAHALEELTIGRGKLISVENASFLKSHPSLKRASIGLGSIKRQKEISDALGLPPQDFFEEFDYL